jgi:hypothetical protein
MDVTGKTVEIEYLAEANAVLEYHMRDESCIGAMRTKAQVVLPPTRGHWVQNRIPMTSFAGSNFKLSHALVLVGPMKVKSIRLVNLATKCVLPYTGLACSDVEVCPQGGCCSEFGWCGTTSAYCGPGCLSQCDMRPIPGLPTCPRPKQMRRKSPSKRPSVRSRTPTKQQQAKEQDPRVFDEEGV